MVQDRPSANHARPCRNNVMVIVKTAISNSLTRGREHDGREFMMEQYVAQGGRCAVTGERFSSSHRDLIPSPDRIDNSKLGLREG